jgi:multidrug efflux system membrane fusion protein
MAFLALFSLVLALAGCSSDGAGKDQKGKSAKNAAVAVTTALCRSADVPFVIEATGRVEASATVGIRSRINGTLETIHFSEGQEVREGAVLFTIDRRPALAVVKTKEALFAKDRAELDQARKALERYRPAAEKGYVSQDVADQAAAKVASLTASVQADEAALDAARLDLQYCTLTAPFTGLAGEIQVDPGNLIKANADAPLVTVNRIAPITVAFDIPGGDLPEVQRYQPQGPLAVTAWPAQKDGKKVSGVLSFIDNTIDQATGTILVKADFANTDKELWPGQIVPVSLLLTTKRGAFVVPSQAVQTGQDGDHVYVVRDDATVEYRRVVSGGKSGESRIIADGLKEGDRVVTDGHLQLVDGGKIIDRANSKVNGEKRSRP